MAGEYSRLLLPPAVGKVLRDMETMATFLTLPMFVSLVPSGRERRDRAVLTVSAG